jgi:uncharacterized protein (TIGR03437 family)
MFRAWLALAATLLCGAARGQAPTYSTASIVNAANYATGPFAPNSVVSIFGVNLAFSTAGLTQSNVVAGSLPFQLANASVYLDSVQVPLLYVSPSQINFMVPSNQIAGDVTIRVVRQGVTGLPVTVTLVDAAPAPFQDSSGFAIAQDWNSNYAVITPGAPAQPGDLLILYVTGMGRTQPNPATGEIPQFIGNITNPAALQILLNGVPIDPNLVKYAGLTPGSAGLYQINFYLPGNAAPNPEIRIAMGSQVSPAGLKLAVR